MQVRIIIWKMTIKVVELKNSSIIIIIIIIINIIIIIIIIAKTMQN